MNFLQNLKKQKKIVKLFYKKISKLFGFHLDYFLNIDFFEDSTYLRFRVNNIPYFFSKENIKTHIVNGCNEILSNFFFDKYQTQINIYI